MYQPYPGATEMPAVQRPLAPKPVRSAVVIMYAGAAVSLVRLWQRSSRDFFNGRQP
jgi:hypothetical protein